MELLEFIATVVLVTASGALAPGPLFFATVSHGTKSGAKGGLAFSIGHTLVEFPLVLLLALVFGEIASEVAGEPAVKVSTGVVGGLFLLIFGLKLLKPCTVLVILIVLLHWRVVNKSLILLKVLVLVQHVL